MQWHLVWFANDLCWRSVHLSVRSRNRHVSSWVCWCVFFCQIKWFFRCGLSFFPLVYQMEVKNCLQVVVLQSNHITLWIKQTTFLSHLWILLAIFFCIRFVFVLCARTYTLFFIQDFFLHHQVFHLIHLLFYMRLHTYISCFDWKKKRNNNNETTTMIQNIEQQRAYSNKST